MTTSHTSFGAPFGAPFDGLDGQIYDQAANLKALEGAANETAEAMDQAFAKAGQSMARSLARAASDGRISLGELASAILNAVNQAAGVSSSGGLGGVLSQVLSAAGVSGARADGGAVSAGSAYLVGERGPEIFRPAVSGSIEAGAAPQVNITLNVQGDGAALARSEAQIASALNRAARMGLR